MIFCLDRGENADSVQLFDFDFKLFENNDDDDDGNIAIFCKVKLFVQNNTRQMKIVKRWKFGIIFITNIGISEIFRCRCQKDCKLMST